MRLSRAYIELTTYCGLECEFCEPKKFSKHVMDLDVFEKIHKNLKGVTKEISYHVLGDPLTVDNLTSYLDISKSYGFNVSLTTSGFYMHSGLYAALLHPAVKQVNISLSSFFGNKNKKTDFSSYMNSICEFASQSSKTPKRFVNLRLWNEGNEKYLDFNQNVYEYLSDYFCVEINRNDTKSKLASYTLLVKDVMFEWPSLSKEPVYEHGKCHAISSQIAFLSDGSVVPCCLDGRGDIKLGSIADEDLRTIISKDRSKNMIDGFRNNLLVEKLCKTCGFRNAKL